MDCKIKICGLTEEREIACVNRWKPDYIGFMFFPKSKRHISFERARELAEQLSPEIKKVGVFVNADLREMTEASKILDLIQLHGQESEETIEILKEKTHLPIIRAVSMTEEKDSVPIQSFRGRLSALRQRKRRNGRTVRPQENQRL